MPPAPTYGITAATSRGLEPDLNRSYLDFAVHAGTAVVPARVAKPRDKAKVETAVQVDMAGMRTEGCLAGQEENVDAGGSERSEWALSSFSHISLPASRSVCDSGPSSGLLGLYHRTGPLDLPPVEADQALTSILGQGHIDGVTTEYSQPGGDIGSVKGQGVAHRHQPESGIGEQRGDGTKDQVRIIESSLQS